MFPILGIPDHNGHSRFLEVADEGLMRCVEEWHGCDRLDSGLEHRIVVDSQATI